MFEGRIWVAKFDWFCNNTYADGSTELVQGWTYTVWENKPAKRDLHPTVPGFVWIDPKGERPIVSMNYVFFERLFPELAFDDSSEPVYFDRFVETGKPPAVLMWWIRSNHGGGVGEVWTPIEDGYVEPRADGVITLCVCFDKIMDTTITDTSAIVISGRYNDGILHPWSVEWYLDMCMILTIYPTLADRDTYTIVIGPEFKSALGYSVIENSDIIIHALRGDVVANCEVDTDDLSAFAPYMDMPVDLDNARFDIDQNGWIDMEDVHQVLANVGHTCPGD